MSDCLIQYTLGEIAESIDGQLRGDPTCTITGIATLQSATTGQISFLSNFRYTSHLKTTQASAVLLKAENLAKCPSNALVVDDPYVSYAHVVKLFHVAEKVVAGIHATAIISKSADIDKSAMIGAHVVIGDNVIIGANTVIDAGCIIQSNVSIGCDTHVYPKVVICDSTTIGDRVVLHPSVVLGSDGFGLANHEGVWEKIPQIGSVHIKDDVEIGAHSTVDRGALDDTVIERGVKIDNHVQIAHNICIGEHTVIAGCVGIAGSTTIGKNCIIGGGTAISGHLEIVDGVVIGGRSTIAQSVESAGIYAGHFPLMQVNLWRRVVFRIQTINQLYKRVSTLESIFSKK